MSQIPQNKQEWLNLLVETSRSGGFPAAFIDAGDDLFCRYRTPCGRKCAVGLLLPDCPELVEGPISEIYDLLPDWAKAEHREGSLLRYVQIKHDDLARRTLRSGSPWPHAEFLDSLRPLFPDCVFPEEAPAAA